MTTTSWQVDGQYYETCSCDFVCPCVPGQMAVAPTKGTCIFAMAFQIERGSYGSVSLDGLGFIVLALTPEAMGKGNWLVGVIADARATSEQREAITAIASGSAGGPMSAVGPLVGKFLGVESAPLVLTSSRKLDVRVGCPSLAEVEYAKSLDLPAWLIPQDAMTRDRYRTVKIIVQNPPYNCGCYGRSLCCPSDFNRVPALQECKGTK